MIFNVDRYQVMCLGDKRKDNSLSAFTVQEEKDRRIIIIDLKSTKQGIVAAQKVKSVRIHSNNLHYEISETI